MLILNSFNFIVQGDIVTCREFKNVGVPTFQAL